MKRLQKYYHIRFILGIALFVSACVPTTFFNPISNSVVTPTITMDIKTDTPVPSKPPSFTATNALPARETKTQRATSDRTALPVVTLGDTLTWTPRSTLSGSQAQAFVIELLRTNGNCNLPCWWGISPGKTPWGEAEAYLATFASSVIAMGTRAEKSYYLVKFDNLPENISKGTIAASIVAWNSVVEEIQVDIYYPLTEILANYGEPDEIWVYVEGFTIMGYKPFFVIALFYARQGILTVYEGSAEAERIVQICPDRIPSVEHRWYFWNPEQRMTFKGAGKKVLLEVKDYRLLEDAAGMDVQTFYETYKDPVNAQQCFGVEDPNYPK